MSIHSQFNAETVPHLKDDDRDRSSVVESLFGDTLLTIAPGQSMVISSFGEI
jgi:hypothetical protein